MAQGEMPRVGEVFVLPEDDYRYGVGPLLARVRQVYRQVAYQGEPWWHLSVDAANGTPENHGGFTERDLYIREASMPRIRQAPRV